MATGPNKNNDVWYAFKDGNDWYYLDDNGYMVTGEYEIDGKIYAFDQNGKWIKYKNDRQKKTHLGGNPKCVNKHSC